MNKINVLWLISNHIQSLRDDDNKLSCGDIILHLITPIVLSSAACYLFKVMPSQVIGIMVNFGAITTALLMSAVIMVYDQKSKLIEKKNNETVSDKITSYSKSIVLYKDLCKNICFAILTSIMIVTLSAILSFYNPTSMSSGFPFYLFITTSFLCYFLFILTMITFLMILKRFSTILEN